MRSIFVFFVFSLLSLNLFAQAPFMSIGEFDQHYRIKLRKAFCSESIYADCFPQSPDSCVKKFDPLFNSCVQKVFPNRSVAASEHTSEKLQQLGKCLGARLIPQGAKIKCRQRPQEF